MQLDGIDGRVALVTGGAQGIGRRMVETFRDLGAKAVAADITEPAIDGTRVGVELHALRNAVMLNFGFEFPEKR